MLVKALCATEMGTGCLQQNLHHTKQHLFKDQKKQFGFLLFHCAANNNNIDKVRDLVIAAKAFQEPLNPKCSLVSAYRSSVTDKCKDAFILKNIC